MDQTRYLQKCINTLGFQVFGLPEQTCQSLLEMVPYLDDISKHIVTTINRDLKCVLHIYTQKPTDALCSVSQLEKMFQKSQSKPDLTFKLFLLLFVFLPPHTGCMLDVSLQQNMSFGLQTP